MQLEKAKRLVAFVFAHPLVSEMAKKGDQLSSNQTDHGMTHFLEVVRLAQMLVQMINAQRPGTFSQWEVEVTIPLAALLHDIGRAINVNEHDKAGAKWSRDFLRNLTLPGDTETLPWAEVKRISKIVACHRSNVVLKRAFDDNCWAVVVLADKFAGDEERVRPVRAAILSVLTAFRLSFIPLREGGIHDRVNFAIKNVEPFLRDDELVLRLNVDRRVCKATAILELYSERYQACHRAAAFLGLKFRLELVSEYSHGIIAKVRSLLGFRKPALIEKFGFSDETNKWLLACACGSRRKTPAA